jgi:monoamine oxidase
MQRIDRRRFLQDSALALASASIGARPFRPVRAQPASPQTAVVLGAGPAGLAAALRLRDAGVRVTALEARSEPGGRVRTVRSGFDDGLYAEAGAARISELHAFVLHYADALGLALDPFPSADASLLLAVDGARVRAADGAALAALPLDLRPDERGLSPAALLQRTLGDTLADLEDPDPDAAAYARWRDHDRLAWPEWLRAHGASRSAVELMTLGSDTRDLSALYVLRQIALHRDSGRFYQIRGGMDRLPRGLADRLGNDIVYNAEALRIDHGPHGVRVGYRRHGRRETIAADRLVVALPFSTLRRIDVHPPLAKAEAIRDLPYYAATRFLIETRRRVWSADHSNGAARIGRAETWDASFGQNGERGVLSVTLGEGIDRTRRDPKLEPTIKTGLGLAREVFPEIAGDFEKGFVQSWSDEPWARGAFAAFRPGQMTVLMPEIARPEGRVHFAGEHTSPWMGWMEGALRSGERAAQEILA